MASPSTLCGPLQLQRLSPVLLRSPSSLSSSPPATTSPTRPLKAVPLAVGMRNRRRDVAAAALVDLRVDMDENPEGILSGEWPENFSLLTYDDFVAYLTPQIYKDQMCPSALLGKVMRTKIPLVTADQVLEEIDHYFEGAPALPVIDDDCRCIGIITRKDKERASDGLKSKVGEIMSSPVVTLTPDRTVTDAAAVMLKMEVHKIPILNDNRQVIGMVTRSDIFHCLEIVEA